MASKELMEVLDSQTYLCLVTSNLASKRPPSLFLYLFIGGPAFASWQPGFTRQCVIYFLPNHPIGVDSVACYWLFADLDTTSKPGEWIYLATKSVARR